MALSLDALRRAALVGADGRGYTPPNNNGLAIEQWGRDQANKRRFATDVNYIQNMATPGRMGALNPNLNASPLPTEWEVMGEVTSGRRRAIENAGGSANVADPLRSRPTRIPTGATRSLTSGTLASSGGTDEQGDAMPSVGWINQNIHGSGAKVAAERAQDELAASLAEEELSRSRLRGQDPSGDMARRTARGNAIADERDYLENVAPQRQRLTNSINALARAAGREERGKDFAAQAPEREYADTQYQARYVTPAQVRANAAVESARLGGESRMDVADTNAGAKVDASRLGALAKQVQELIRAGQLPAAEIRGDQIEPVDEVGQAIKRIQAANPDATPQEVFDALGDELTDEERAKAYRLLGGG